MWAIGFPCIGASPQTSLLPGMVAPAASSATPASWPRFLFLFRGALPDFRHEEVRASAGTLGVDVSRVSFEAASLGDESNGSDFDLLQWVQLPDAETAAAVAERACMVRACFEVWASAKFDMAQPTHDVAGAALCADERWQCLADATQLGLAGGDATADGAVREPAVAEAAEARARMLSSLSDESWRCDTFSIGWKKPRTLQAKIALMEKFDALLTPLPGEVSLKSPRHVIALIEDCRGPPNDECADVTVADLDDEMLLAEAAGEDVTAMGEDVTADVTAEARGGGGGGIGAVRPPSCLFLGRQLSAGAASHLARFALSRRPYLGRTTLPPAYALLMANQARVVEGSLVLDPFCGTGSTLLSCAARGARTVGVEIDERVLLGGANGEGILMNFRAAGVAPPERLVLGDASRLDAPGVLPAEEVVVVGEEEEAEAGAAVTEGEEEAEAGAAVTEGEASAGGGATGEETRLRTVASPYARFDAIVTDPPYGLMEGLGSFYMPLHERLDTLLRLSARRLRLGGRLVFLLPIPSASSSLDALFPNGKQPPTSRCLELETVCRQRMSLRMHRLMLTMRKVAEPQSEDEGWLPPTAVTAAQFDADPRDGAPPGAADDEATAGRTRAAGDQAAVTADEERPAVVRRGHGGDAAGTGAAVAPWDVWWEQPPDPERSP